MMMTGSSSSSSSSTAVFHRPNARFLSVPAASSHRGSTVAPIPSFSIQDSAPEEDYVFPEPNPMSPSSNDCCYESALADGFLDAPPRPSQSKDDTLSFVTARVSGATAFSKSSDIADKESRRSILSSGDDEADDECSSSSSFCSRWSAAAAAAGDCWGKKPHQANDARWEAIRAVRAREGHLGLGHFKVLDRLGSGDIGCVYLAELSGTRTRFAVKVMDKAQLMSRKKLSRARTEREILQCLDHPFLPTLYAHFETEKFSCLVMDFCSGGDLRVLQQRQPGECFTEKASRFYAAEVLLALEYLHMLGIIYRDLKPENVLIREDGHIVLSDFDLSLMCVVFPTLVKSTKVDLVSPKNSGSYVQPPCAEPSTCMKHSCLQPTCFSPRLKGARRSKPRKENTSEIGHHGIMLPELIAEPSNARSQSFVGTHEYLAPEIIKGEGHGSAVDWWTFGIFLYELLFGKTPFKGSGHRATLFNVVCEPLEFPDFPAVSYAARDLIRGLLVKEPQQRLAYQRGAAEVKQHPFFQSMNWALIRCVSPPEMPRTIINEVSTGGEFSVILEGNVGGVNLKPSGQYLDMDFY